MVCIYLELSKYFEFYTEHRVNKAYLLADKEQRHSIITKLVRNIFRLINKQPVAEVLGYRQMQVSSISCRIVGSIPTMLGKTLTQQL